MCQYCLDLGIDAAEPLLWKHKGRQLRIDLGSPTCSHRIRGFLRTAIEELRAGKIGNVQTVACLHAIVGLCLDLCTPRSSLTSPR